MQKAQEIFERERQAYWAMREALMQTHWGKWIAIAGMDKLLLWATTRHKFFKKPSGEQAIQSLSSLR